MAKQKCTCAKYEHPETEYQESAECGNVAIATTKEIVGEYTFTYLYCKKHVKMFVERGWREPSFFTLLPGKKLPKFETPKPTYSHNWRKVNLITISDKSGVYDILHCTKCGEQFERYGVSTPVGGCPIPDEEGS